MNVAKKKLIKRPIRPNELRDITGNEIEHNKLFEDTGFISEDAVELEIDPMPRYVLLLSLMKTGITASLGSNCYMLHCLKLGQAVLHDST